MFHLFMRVNVRMSQATRSHSGMIMVVMPIIVTMLMFVRHQFVHMAVLMLLPEQQHSGTDHQRQRNQKKRRERIPKQDKGKRRTNERGGSKERAGAYRA